jgi:hypothetical protein
MVGYKNQQDFEMAKRYSQPKTFMECQRRHSLMARELAKIGWVWPGTVQRRMLTCGKPQCICHRDAEARHGPYFYWTSKKNGKTVSRKLTQREAEILEAWINNRRKLDATVKRMMEVSERALHLTLRVKT